MPTIATQLLELSGETTSPGYISDEAIFTEYATDEHRYLFVHYEHDDQAGVTEITDAETLARTDWTIHGFSMAGHFTEAEYREQIHVSLDRIFEETPLAPDDFPLSVVKVLAVAPEHQSRGIGTQLTATTLTEMFRNPPVVTMIWLRDNPANLKITHHYSDFVLATFEDYFPDDWACPDCGPENDCTCTVVLYGWFSDDRGLSDPETERVNDEVREYAD